MSVTMDWQAIQAGIRTCRHCEEKAVPHLRVPCGDKRSPPWAPLGPVRLYFVSVAPPWGGAYFWDESGRDAVREGLFTALRKPLGVPVRNCRQFRDLRLFLTPAVKCPSSKNGKDHAPSTSAVNNCGHFLRSELLAARAERILALGRTPFASLCDIFKLDAPREVASFRKDVWWVRLGATEVPLTGTYFPGNDRHKGFPMIGDDIGRLLAVNPRTPNS
jgi:uracil-DNA glycosylase